MKKMRFLLFTLLAVAAIFISCAQGAKNKTTVVKELIGTYKGKDIYQFTLTNKSGNVIKVTNFGARLTWIEVPDKDGKKENVTFGFDTFDGMIKGDPYFGAVVGRYANRIAKGKFSLDGTEYSLAINNFPNSLHGGPGGWHSVVWDAEILAKSEFPTVKFTYTCPDMEEGYPGNMNVEANYTWNDKNEIVIDYACTTDKKTVLNITNHAYFNLHGAGNGNILDHQLVIKGSHFVPVDSTLIPTGEIRPVAGTPFDFTTPHTIGERIGENYDQLRFGKGYDHTFVLDKKEEVEVSVYDPSSGRFMEVISDQPGVQFYSGNFLNGILKGYGGKPYVFRSGLCLEMNHYPDSPNHPEFPSTILNPGETFKSQTIYRFSVK
jgi:aldose 1-epimerase